MTTEAAFPDHGLPRIPIDRVDIDSDEAQRRVAASQPFVTRVNGWRALEWDIPYLQRRVGASPITLQRSTGEPVTMTIGELLGMVEDPTWMQRFVPPDGGGPLLKIWRHGQGLDPALEPLFADLELPRFIPRDRISSINLWARNFGLYDNGSHCEPNAMANLNLQVRGKKHVWLFPPTDAACLGVTPAIMEPPFVAVSQEATRASDEHPRFADAHCYETVLEPGDAIFIPTFWFHWFVHYPLYQLNLNFWFEVDPIPLTPISANWAYLSALCTALGGFEHAIESFSRLPAETQALLRRIEDVLLNDRHLLSPPVIGEARRRGPRMGRDPKQLTGRKRED
jgi:Cupin-like domain